MARAVEKGFEVHQLDFVSAYMNGEIEEELYMEIPDHLPNILSEAELQTIPINKVLKLKKALYGLKQSGRQWFTKLDEKLRSMSFKQSGADNCVYTLQDGNNITIVVIYVDDVIAASNIEK
ncbi:retroelement polyprotein [Lasius niger]|uniref:Retroelement polyprotein n=1 Tax=Lasius niger TaxID=67767 RepID=A0A0J7JYR4_LASNI|nr:retroelement polyprotein [Lasius niger]